MRAALKSQSSRDGQLLAFLCCMWVLTLLGTLGGELRLILHQGGYVLATFLMATFYLACFLTRTLLIDQAVFHPKVVKNGKAISVQLLPALDVVRDHVRGRARELGIPGTLHVYYLPGTWTSVDAYVFGASSNQIVVVTGGLLSLYVPADDHRMSRFRFIVDHELGHVAGRDTDLLYLARATLIVGAGLLLLKCVLIAAIGPDAILHTYSNVFPRSIAPAGFIGPTSLVFSHGPGTPLVVAFFSLFTAFCLGISAYFYVAIARRREELADRFAIRHSEDRERAKDAMTTLLTSSPLSTAPPHAFLGSKRWHPSAQERLDSVHAHHVESIPYRLRMVMVVLTFFVIRFMLGDITSPLMPERDISGLIVASAAYALMMGLIVDLVLRDGEQRSTAAELRHVGWQILSLVGWTAMVSLVLALAHGTLRMTDSFVRDGLEGGEFLIDVEITERTWLILSMPIAIGAFGVSHLLLSPWRNQARLFHQRALFNLASSSVAIGLLVVIGAWVAKPVSDYRLAKFEAYWNARVQTLETGKRANERRIEKLRGGLEHLGLPRPEATDLFGFKRDVREELNLFPEESVFFASRLADPFLPPLSVIALWQAPLRGTAL